jgi:hypothetical protein
MALWTMAITCDKAGFKSRFCQEHKAGKNIISVNPVILSISSSCPSCASWLKNPCNPWLINNLRLRKITYEKINLFLQNKANFRKVKFDVNKVLTRDYVQMDTWSIRKTKPIQSQLKPIQSQSNPILCQNKPKQTQIKPKTNPISKAKTAGFYGYFSAKYLYNRSIIESTL